MAKKKLSPEQKLDAAIEELRKNYEKWDYIDKNGCTDPSWSDGINMNLVRNHIVIGRNVIRELCNETGMEFPEEYHFPVPPKVNDHYMANFSNKRRIEMLKGCGSYPIE